MRINRIVLLLSCACAAGPCLAEITEASAQGQAVFSWPATYMVPAVSADASTPQPQVSDIGTPVDPANLDRLRGGESTVDNEVLIDGAVEGNTADRIVSGPNGISDGSFANASGINTVIQNTGNNVLIQNGMVVNVQFVAPPSP